MGQKEFGQEKGDRLWLRYIGHHWKSLCLLLVSALLFFLVFLAYRLEWEAVWYAAVLVRGASAGFLGIRPEKAGTDGL